MPGPIAPYRHCETCNKRKPVRAFFNGSAVCRLCNAARRSRLVGDREAALLVEALRDLDVPLRDAIGPRWHQRVLHRLREHGVTLQESAS
jgi:hypothetical protein